MKARYLTFFSYIGTHFRSSEKLWFKEGKNYPDTQSVQGMVELGLLKLKTLNYPTITLSSRTDGGVHALCSAAHFDLERYGSKMFDPYHISYNLNKFFYQRETSIFIKNCIRVSDDFNARAKALSRTYLYRFAVLKEGVTLPEYSNIGSYIPVEEWRRCYFVRLRGFNEEKFREGLKHLVGYHDFTTFKRFDKRKQNKHSRRELLSAELRRGAPLVTSYTRQQADIFNYWEVEFKGRAFVHNQIRRMVGALMGVAIGRLPPEEIQVMLQVPSKHSWHQFLNSCPADGLYLCDVKYDPAHLIYDGEQHEQPTAGVTQTHTDLEDQDITKCDKKIVNKHELSQ